MDADDALGWMGLGAFAMVLDFALIFLFQITLQFWFISIWKIGAFMLVIGLIGMIIAGISAAEHEQPQDKDSAAPTESSETSET